MTDWISDKERRRILNLGEGQEKSSYYFIVSGMIVTAIGIFHYISSDTTVIEAGMYHNDFFFPIIGVVLVAVGAVLRVNVARRRSREERTLLQKRREVLSDA